MSNCPIDFRIKLSYNWAEVSAVEEYKEKFQMLFQEMSKAIRILSDARQECIGAYVAIAEEKLGEEDAQK